MAIRLSENFVYDVVAHFFVYDVVALNTYCLSLNTRDFTWQYGIKEEYPFPPNQPFSVRR
jgi:hypothetical protein